MLHKDWSSPLESKDPDEKSLEALAELVREEAKLRMPHHQKRIDLIKTKRGQEKDSHYLES